MNEKKILYSSLGNQKDLIDKKNPNESDMEKFYKWRDINSKRLKIASIVVGVMLAFIVMMGLILWQGIVLIVLALFGLIEFFVINEYKKSKKYILEYCDYGIVVDKYVTKHKDDKDYYAIVEANNNKLKYKLTTSENNSINISDSVVIFAVSNREFTFIAKNN